MIVQSIPYPTSAGSSTFGLADFALVSRGTAAFSSTSGDPVAWTTEVYDDSGMVDLGSSASRITIQNSGLYRVLAGVPAAADTNFRLSKNGADFDGFAKTRAPFSTTDYAALASGIISASAADYFQLHKDDTDTTAPAAGSWMGVEKFDSALKYCLVKKTATQSLTSSTTAQVVWANAGEVADVGGWFDSAVSTTRFTVPSGVTRVRISASIDIGSTNGGLAFWITNGAGTVLRGCPNQSRDQTNGLKAAQVVSAVLPVSAGDTFRVNVQSGGVAATIPASGDVWFCIEEVPDYARVLAYRSTSLVVGPSTKYALDSSVYDTAGALNTTNGTIVVPSGYTKMRCTFSIDGADTKNVAPFVCKSSDGLIIPGQPFSGVSSGQCWANAMGTWTTVAAGEEYQLTLLTAGGQTLAATNGNWLCAEFRP